MSFTFVTYKPPQNQKSIQHPLGSLNKYELDPVWIMDVTTAAAVIINLSIHQLIKSTSIKINWMSHKSSKINLNEYNAG